ncbi:hypothetical protein [Apilactobacillus xinyiensis]|uniref:Uncharacterized protein n=1 Tax=Apilactobacillus xinyiensis TaxID=2841032 RepID=A0ABT0I2F6_9LACO|nr:hypothetical protein [Apilactobacillus xinyiensis]MCK8624901.1 hypothetical protein [Apilactobacillus xinyiensis]MCL0330265.1 hypothetical protein [Apilactobacillus xinyiensis]
MQFNKNEFKKVNDKKIMKKVKKQWVVVSVATLSLLGGGVSYLSHPDFLANADETNDSTLGNLSKQETDNNSNAVSESNAQTAEETNSSGLTYAPKTTTT